MGGHLWTIGPTLLNYLRPVRAPRGRAWATVSVDASRGSVPLSGHWHEGFDERSRRRALVLIHGLGGSIESGYLKHAASAAWDRGYSVLRLNLRGSDGSGADLYHAGLTLDIEAALASPELAAFEEVDVWGFSLGGHVALRWAATRPSTRRHRVVAVCPPLDLSLGATALDQAFPLYRHYILRRLNHLVDAAHRKGLALPSSRSLRGVESIRVWDGLVVGPFFGFRDAEDYYTRASVAPLLAEITLPTLLIHSRADPMVPFETVRAALGRLSPTTVSRITERGGHVGFPADLDLGLGPTPGLRGQVLDWLTA